MVKELKKASIIVHHDDIDGIASAWVLIKKEFERKSIRKRADTTLISRCHQHKEVCNKKIEEAFAQNKKQGFVSDLYFVDSLPDKKLLDKIIMLNKNTKRTVGNIHLFDHHKVNDLEDLRKYTPPEEFEGMPMIGIHIDPERPSAARMIWDLFCDQGEKTPPIIKFMDQLDKSKFETEKDIVASAYVDSVPIFCTGDSLKGIKLFEQRLVTGVKGTGIFAKRGVHIDRFHKNIICDAFNKFASIPIQIAPNSKPVNALMINANLVPFGRRISIELERLAKRKETIACSWRGDGKTIALAIRADGKKIDCFEVAQYLKKRFNKKGIHVCGGGHDTMGSINFDNSGDFFNEILSKTKQENLSFAPSFVAS